MNFQRSHFNVFLMSLAFYLTFLRKLIYMFGFYPTALKGCQGIVFTNGVWMGIRAGGQREKVCPGCISEAVRCRKFILGRDIGWGGVGVQRHGLTLI